MFNLKRKLFPNYFIQYQLDGWSFNKYKSKPFRFLFFSISLLILFFLSNSNLSAQVCGTSGQDGPQNAATGIYHASAQATYLDPTRTNANPLRKISGSTNPFIGFNSTYETGEIVNVTGTNYNGDLLTSSVEDVNVNSITIYNPCDNAVTGGNFGQPPGEYNVVGPWTPIYSGEKVKIVEEGLLRGAALKQGLYSLKQSIQFIKPSSSYTLSMTLRRWTGSTGCNANSNASYRIRIYNPANPLINLLDITNTTNDNTPIIINETFNTATSTSLILLIEESSSGPPACPLFVDDITINSPIVIATSSSNITCNGANNGKINITELSGAAAPYQLSYSSNGGNTYSIAQNTGAISTSGAPFSFSNLTPGNYKLQIIDANGCINIRDFTISEPPILTLSETHIDNSCFSNAIGAIDLTVSGGTAPYAYQWIKGGSNYATTQDINGLPQGNYTVTVTDSKGCIKQLSVDILPLTPFTVTGSIINNICFGNNLGSITLNASGGESPYSYTWSNGSNNQNQYNLIAGNYTVVAKDALGCEVSLSFVITQPPQITTSIITQTNVECFGNNTGSVRVSGSNGISPYEFSLNGTTFQNSNVFSNLTAGAYAITVKDANGCTVLQNVIITQPAAALSSSITSQTNVACFGNSTGSVTVTGSNGTGPYNYSLNGAAFQTTGAYTGLMSGTYTVTVRDANGCLDTETINITQPSQVVLSGTATPIQCNGETSTVTLNGTGGTGVYDYSINGTAFQASNIFSNLTLNSYTFTIRDANGCLDTETINITQPAIITLSAAANAITCFNGTTTATLTAGGGTAPFQYSIDNGGTFQTSNQFNNLTAGSYTFKIRDANNCTIPDVNLNITQPPALTLSGAATAILCKGGNSTVTLMAIGGTGIYQFSIDGTNFQTANTFNNLLAGNYKFYVKDANNCTIPFITINITEPAQLTLSAVNTSILCKSGYATITLTATGGTGVYQYSMDGINFQNSNTFGTIVAGNYNFYVKDANNCSIPFITYSITEPPLLSISETQVNINCNGDNSGSININISGGAAPYTYTWSNGATTLNQSNLPAGSYTISVTDANNCQTSKAITLTQPTNLSINASRFNIKCFGEATGSVNISVAGGTAPYTYSWNNGATTKDLTGLTAGTYSLTVTDGKGCLSFATISITQPLSPISLSETHVNNTCFTENQGSIDLSVSGGVGPYLYSWSNGLTTQDINNLAPGNYTVTVTDANLCTATKTITITPLAPFAIVSSSTNVLCNGENTGVINLNLSGGTLPYIITWNNGATTQNLQNLAAGTYTYIARDNNGCEITNSITINQPGLLTITGTNTLITCNGDLSTVTLTSTGGTGAYQYSKDGTNFQTSNIIPNLSAGAYTFSVKDANNCIKTFSLTITQPVLLTLTGINTPILCNGDLSQVTLTSTGGTGACQYSKDGSTFQSSNIFSNLLAGSYIFSVKDANNCIKTFPLTIAQPALLTLSGSNTTILCNGDLSTVTLISTGGTGAYQYSKDGTNFQSSNIFSNLSAGSYTFSVKDVNNCIKTFPLTITQPVLLTLSGSNTTILCNGDLSTVTLTSSGGTGAYQYSKDGTTFQSSNIFSNLSAGAYTFRVRDANNCIKTFSTTINQPTALTISSTQQNVLCFGQATGSINITISGGTAPYNYAWNNGAITEDLSNLIAGTYALIVTDANQCKVNKTIVITQPSAALNVTEAHQNIKCFGDASGLINISVNGGTAPYTYSWNNGSTTEDLSTLIAGNYSVTVTDANNCSITRSVTITQPTAALAATEIHQDVNCFGVASGAIDISVSGGTAPYKYSWNNNATSQDISSLLAGNYSVIVTDANDCKTTLNIAIQQPSAPLSAIENHQNILCFGQATGSININVNGGTAPYTYLWNNGVTTKDLNGIIAGIYNVVITDAKGCKINKQIQITQPNAALTINEAHENVKCFGEINGKIDLTISGGTAPYTYLWSNGISTQDLNNLTSGTYSVTVTDANRCVISRQIQITQPVSPLSLTETHVNNSCFGDKIGAINVSVSGGTTPYTYKWNTGQITQDLTNLDGGVYVLTVTDANNCTQTISATILPLQAFVVAESMQNVKCFNESTGSINLNLSGGESPYTITWSNGATGNQLSNLKAGNYTYKAVDAYGCTLQKTITITQPQALVATFIVTNTSCKFSPDGAIALNVTGGIAPYKYTWNGLDRGPNASLKNISSGKYIITITDANSCSIFVDTEVLPGNCAPNAGNDKYTTNEDTPITIKTPGVIINDSDPDQDEITIMLSTVKDPNSSVGSVSGNTSSFTTVNGGVIINNNGSFTYTPKKNFAGIERFVYKVSDGSLLSNFATVTIEVLAVNDPPVAVDDNYSTPEDTPFDGTVIPNDSDVDGDLLNYKLLAQPTNAVVSFNADGTFRFVPVLNFNGTITFNYQVCDPFGLCDTATVTVIVTPVNDPPVALDDTFKTQINLPFNNRVIDNDSDIDNDPLQYSALTQTANGTLIFNTNGTFVYTPRNGFKGTDTFTYRTCDPSGLCDDATVTILVQPIVTVNLTPGSGTIKEGEKISITAVLTESIFEDAIITLAYGGTATNNSDYTLTGNFVTITIPAGQTATTQSFTINAINDALKDDGEQVFANVTETSSIYVLIGTGAIIDITDIYPTSIPLKPEENPDINPDPLVSPNRDGQGNDKFIIYNITKYPNNEVLIFNRWGNEVFKIAGYNNNDKAFEGIANTGILTNTNKDLVDGVYYYVIYTTVNGVKNINRGYLILKR